MDLRHDLPIQPSWMITSFRAFTLVLLLAGMPALRAASAAPINHPAAIAEARRAWGDDSRELADLLRRMADAAGKAKRAEDKLAEARKTLAKLRDELADTLAELRSGAFCTGCGRTRSDLLAKGESFPHPGQRSRPATPEELAKAERDFEARMEVQRRLIDRYEPELKEAESDVRDLHHRYLVLLPKFHLHLAQEQEHRLGKWLDEKTVAETELKAIHEAIAAQTERIKAIADADEARLARADLAQVERQLAQRVSASRIANDRARQEERFFRKDVLSNLDSLGRLAEAIPNRMAIDGRFISTSIRNPPRPVGYTVNDIYVGGPNATVSDLQRLLSGAAKANPTPKPDASKLPAGDKSVKDLLEGK